jgi:hypothetical protein
MNTQPKQSPALQSVVSKIPIFSQVHGPGKKKLIQALEGLDKLFVMNEKSQEIFVDESTFHKLVSSTVSPEFAETYVAHLKSFEAEKIFLPPKQKSSHLVSINWLDSANHTKFIQPLPESVFDAFVGITPSSSEEEIRLALEPIIPNIPKEFWEKETFERAIQKLVQSSASPLTAVSDNYSSSAFACFEKTLGYWGAFAAMGVIITVVAMFPFYPPGAILLAIAIIVTGSAALAILSCLLNSL